MFTCSSRVADDCKGTQPWDPWQDDDGNPVCGACKRVLERRRTPFGVTD